MIYAKGLGYGYPGSDWCLSDISFELPIGGTLAITGPNGAGKTTLIKILATLLHPQVGELNIANLNSIRYRRKVRRLLAYVPQKSAVSDGLTIIDNLNLAASFHGYSPRKALIQNRELLDCFGLAGMEKKRVAQLSGGQHRKLALARAFIGTPELLLLDEPTVGLDANSRERFHALLRGLAEMGTTIVMVTHDIAEIHGIATCQLELVDGGSTGVSSVKFGGSTEKSVRVRLFRPISEDALLHYRRYFKRVFQIDPFTLEVRVDADVPLNKILGLLANGEAIAEVVSNA